MMKDPLDFLTIDLVDCISRDLGPVCAAPSGACEAGAAHTAKAENPPHVIRGEFLRGRQEGQS